MRRFSRTLLTTLPAIAITSIALAQAEPEATEAADPNLFSGSISQSIAALLAFGIVFFLLYAKAWGPILKGLQDRENKIKGDLDAAEKANNDAQTVLADYEQKVAAAHAEARQLIDSARADSEKLRQKLTSETEAEITRLKDRAADQIEQAKQAAVADLYNQSAQLAVTVASKILQREINDADTDQLVQQSLSELGNIRNN